MSIPSVNSNPSDLLVTRDQPVARPADSQPRANGTVSSVATTAPVEPASSGRPQQASRLPVQAPAGTDPALWSILTGEERAFFARDATSGPLTYFGIMLPGSSSLAATPSSRGRRIDVRV
jgi:hypothetical protein